MLEAHPIGSTHYMYGTLSVNLASRRERDATTDMTGDTQSAVMRDLSRARL